MSNFKKHHKLHSKLLISITLCITLTLLVSTTVYYFYYIRVEKEQAFEANHSSLTLRSKEVINMTSIAQSLAFQMYRSSTLSKLLYYPKPNVYDVTAAMTELNNYLNSMPYIESIYVYNPKSGTFYIASSQGQNGLFSKNELADTDIIRVLEHYQDYKPFTPIPRTYPLLSASDSEAGAKQAGTDIAAYTYLCYDAINSNEAMNSAVIVNVSAAWMNKEMAEILVSGGAAYILDDQGTLLSGTTLTEESLDEKEQLWLHTRVKKQTTGYFVEGFHGKRSLISYTSPDGLGWQYISVTPYESVVKMASVIRNAMLLIAAIIALAGFVASWLLSKMLYTPIGQIVNHMNSLESEKRNSIYTMRQNILRNVIGGIQLLPSGERPERLHELGITFQFDKDYRLVLLRIDDYARWRNERGSDLLPYKFAIMNIASEICGQTYRVETVDIDEDSILLMLNILDPAEYTDPVLLETLLRQIREACIEYLKLSVSLTYSAITSQPERLHLLYRQVREASMHRFFRGHGCIINAQHTTDEEVQNTYIYPADKEKKMLDTLLSGHTDDAHSMLADLLMHMEEYPFSTVKIAISRLIMSVNNATRHMSERNGFSVESRTELPSPDRLETAVDLIKHYHLVFDHIRSGLTEKRNTKQERLVRQINERIEQAYADPDFCLNQIAEELDRSPIYVSRLYKQQTMSTIVEVIQQLRIRKACELLEQTDWSVADVAEQTGFASSSYFHRMFKRSLGVTPTDFRRSKANAQ
ncbi:helix-turn-helix domain-containing protein [Paenibacillus farraposensis]|uniref:Helix-turn-helix domain-containing protein n=1 Tax=Paenibacillus farraposensis TaxID=2807095 RepID=A0ABW4DJ21_9BACL|nr:helix-turn-helix domain-containing protein [Paenibacillus farraposensis]MCC3380136.1 AraC family transcriptional regulator [Paenibacillus farraposensis]